MSDDHSAKPTTHCPQTSTDLTQAQPTFERTVIGTKLQHGDSAPDLPSLGLNITERKKRKHDGVITNTTSYISDMFASFSRKQDNLFQELKSTINNIKEQNEELKKSVDTMSSKYDEFLSRISALESDRKRDKVLIHQLEEKIENLERKTRITGIEIRNIPKKSGETKESISETVKGLGKVLMMELGDSDIRDVYRINTKDGAHPIIAEFSSAIVKEKIVNKVKTFNKSKPKNEKLNTSHLKFSEPKKPIFISETLTHNTQKLFYLARNFQKNYNYNFCWTSRGVVYLRKDEKSPQIKICTEADFEKLRKPV